jgi:hypothetical protein
MDRKLLIAFFLLPGLAQAAICKMVGEDGVVSFTNVPTAECPQGTRASDYARPIPIVERAGNVNPGVSARQVEFAGYKSIRITSPKDGGTVRSNEGRVAVSVTLDPGLQHNHSIAAYFNGRVVRGRFGSMDFELTGVERGTHNLYVQVSDARGKILIKSGVISFTVHKVRPKIVVSPVTGDNLIDANDARGLVEVSGTFEGAGVNEDNFEQRLKVRLRFPASGWQSRDARLETKESEPNVVVWTVRVPGRLLAAEASFAATANVDNRSVFMTTSTHSVDPNVFSRFGRPPPANYGPAPAADFSSPGGGIPSAPPGNTNPAFAPRFTP